MIKLPLSTKWEVLLFPLVREDKQHVILKCPAVWKSFGKGKLVLALLSQPAGWEMWIWEGCLVLIMKAQSFCETPVLRRLWAYWVDLRLLSHHKILRASDPNGGLWQSTAACFLFFSAFSRLMPVAALQKNQNQKHQPQKKPTTPPPPPWKPLYGNKEWHYSLSITFWLGRDRWRAWKETFLSSACLWDEVFPLLQQLPGLNQLYPLLRR